MVYVLTEYISASTNRFSNASHVSSSSLVAFGSTRLIALWNADDPFDTGVFETLPGHKGLVTCVRFVDDRSIISADDEGFIKCWRFLNSQWGVTATVRAHTQSISALCVLEDRVVSAGSDSLVIVWGLAEGNNGTDVLRQIQTINMNGRYPLSLEIAQLPGSSASIIAIGGTDSNIQIWTCSEASFVRSAVLYGHEDWVRGLSFYTPLSGNGTVILASGSQDGTVRLWNIEPLAEEMSHGTHREDDPLSDELLDAFEASLADPLHSEEGGRQISLKRYIITVKNKTNESLQKFTITFDALLVGHEAAVTYLSWRPPVANKIPTLLSTSTDSSVILWSPFSSVITSLETSTTLWINRQRFGDIGGQRLGGFVGGFWAKAGTDVVSWGWNGGWRRWTCTDDGGNHRQETWSEVPAITGHHGPVRGIDWSLQGHYLMSASIDQTTRIHAPIPISESDGTVYSWHEISRPQVHGYDLLGASFLEDLRFVSIADEKVVRVFEAPHTFVETVTALKIVDWNLEQTDRPFSATVPPLGLSNKALKGTGDENVSHVPTRRPLEGELTSMTLWPEIEKIFGHGYESISLAVSNSRQLIATACKAASSAHAVVRIYSTENWQALGTPLEGHSLTITRIAFSPDDQLVLTVSRDRSWRLFKKRPENDYVQISTDKSHSRIIWDCAWTVEGDAFATASRDKTVKIWMPQVESMFEKWEAIGSIQILEAATAVAFDKINTRGCRKLAVGLETGQIFIYSSKRSAPSTWDLDLKVDPRLSHVDHVHRMLWRSTSNDYTRQLATCSEDGTLRILTVHV